MRSDNRSRDIRDKEKKLEALHEIYYDRIARYIFVRVGNQADAEDLACEVFLKALEALHSYKERGIPMQAWLFKIAHNLVVDHYRKSTRHKTVSIDRVSLIVESSTEEQMTADLEIARVVKALDMLTKSQRKVIELRFFGGLSSEEAGHVLNKRAGAVRELQSAAIKTLRNLLDKQPSQG